MLLPRPLTPLCGVTVRETSVVPTSGDPVGRGQTTLCRAAPSLREGRDKGNRAPSRKDGHSLSRRYLQAVSTVIQSITGAAKGKRQRNLKDPPAGLGPAVSPLPVHGLSAAASALPESQGHRGKVGTGPTSPVKKRDTAVPALFTMTQLLCAV